MNETRKQTRDRLQKERRWPQFTQRRRELVASGMTEDDAHTQALAEFPPAADAAIEEGDDLSGKEPARIDLRKDVEWVYQHLGEAKPRGAPSSGAPGLHKWARDNFDAFLRSYMLRLMPRDARDGTEERERPEVVDPDEAMELIGRWIDENEHKWGGPTKAPPVPSPETAPLRKGPRQSRRPRRAT